MNKQLAVAAMMTVFGMGCGVPESAAPGDELASAQQGLSTFGPWSAPVNLGSMINGAVVEAGVHVTKDGRALYFVSNRAGGKGGIDVYVSQRASEDDAWGPAVNVPALNSAGDDFCPATTSDGLTLVFSSTRAGGCGGQDLYVSHRTDASDHQSWSAPVHLPCGFNTAANDGSPGMRPVDPLTGNYVMYFWSNRAGGEGGNDIYVATMAADDSVVEAPVAVADVNGALNDMRPDVRRDGKELFFESNRAGGVGGSDIWVATRADDGSWNEPTLVENVNSKAAEGSPGLSWDAQTLYFYSNRVGGFGNNDLYVSTRAKKNGK